MFHEMKLEPGLGRPKKFIELYIICERQMIPNHIQKPHRIPEKQIIFQIFLSHRRSYQCRDKKKNKKDKDKECVDVLFVFVVMQKHFKLQAIVQTVDE